MVLIPPLFELPNHYTRKGKILIQDGRYDPNAISNNVVLQPLRRLSGRKPTANDGNVVQTNIGAGR